MAAFDDLDPAVAGPKSRLARPTQEVVTKDTSGSALVFHNFGKHAECFQPTMLLSRLA